MTFQIKPATRQGIIPLIGLWGGTGGGKTHTALLLARGLAGPKGRVVCADTEHRRASYYSDKVPGSFSHLEFDEPYSPERYLECLEELEKSADVAVIDSMTHLWEGPDGICDLHEQVLDRMCGKSADDWKERERLNWPAWREPKARYKPVRDKILRFKIPLICCLRGQQKSRMVKEGGRNAVITDTNTTPVFDSKFIFEMHIAVEVVQIDGKGGYINYPRPHAKVSHEDIRRILPDPDKTQLGVVHGEALARWCAAGATGPAPADAIAPSAVMKRLKSDLWTMTKAKHMESAEKLNQWLWDEMCMDPSRTVQQLSEQELRSVTMVAAKKLGLVK